MFARPLSVYDAADQHDAAGFLFYPQDYKSIITHQHERAWTIFRKRKMDDTAHVRVGTYRSATDPIQYHIKLSIFRDYFRYMGVCMIHGVQPLEQEAWKAHLAEIDRVYAHLNEAA